MTKVPNFITPIMDNIVRLQSDVELLIKAQRYSSAFVLGVIALEEMGKLILLMWKHDDLPLPKYRRTAHLTKQAAMASLILTATIITEITAIVVGPGIDEDAVNQLAQQIATRPEGHQLIDVENELLEKAKWAGLYQDNPEDENATMREFHEADVIALVRSLAQAIKGVSDAKTRLVANVLFNASKNKFKDQPTS